MKGLDRTPSLGDRRGFMPPQLKTKNKMISVSKKGTNIAGTYVLDLDNISDLMVSLGEKAKIKKEGNLN